MQQWLVAPSEPLKIRDEALTKLFFTAKAAGSRNAGLIDRLHAERQRMLRQVECMLAAALPDSPLPEPRGAAKLRAPELAARCGAHAARTVRHWAKDILRPKEH